MVAASYQEWLAQARTAVQAGDLAGGRQCFQNALKLRDNSVDAHYGLATVCYLQKDLPAAAIHLQAVEHLDPLHAGAAINLGALYNVMKDYDEAVKHLRRGIQLDPSRSEGYYNLGIAYRKLGRLELAIQAYREANRLNPRMVEAVYNLANVYFEMARFEQAAYHYRKALEIQPNFKRASEGLARAEKKVLEAKRPMESGVIATGEVAADDPIELDHRYERAIDPVHERDLLSRFYVETEQAVSCAQNWSLMTERLDMMIREVAKHLSSNGHSGERQMCLAKFRETLARFRATQAKFEESLEHLATVRNELIERA
jgi:tetratricopeptide (TPR) repeat protein